MVNPEIITSSTSLAVAGGAIAALSLFWLVRIPRLAIFFLGAALVAGQLLRFPVPGQAGGLLISDITVTSILIAAGVRFLGQREDERSVIAIILGFFIPFIMWSLFTLVVNAPQLPLTAILIAGLYWARLSSYLLLLPALLVLLKDRGLHTYLSRIFLGVLGVLVGLAVIQLWLVPDLQIFGRGWDPHIQRAVSTWLDPNYFGAFLVIGLLYCLALLPASRHRAALGLLAVLVFGVLLLTESRSALIMLVVSTLVTLPWVIGRYGHLARRHWPLVLGTALLAVLLVSAGVALLGERALGTVAFDPTVELRLAALERVWGLVTEYGLFGVGYNTYQFAAIRAGLIGDFSIHSRAGADNSLLTIWVTTGVVGVTLFLAMGASVALLLWQRWRLCRSPVALAAIASLGGLTLHSQFVNSLLYAHLLVALTIVVALAFTATRPLKTDSL